jgi:hypothetical protein
MPRALRDNAFLVAAVLLPALVVGFFLIATAVPRWRVAPPAYDAVLRSFKPWESNRSPIQYDVAVRDGRVEVTAKPAERNSYARVPVLFLYDHQTQLVREIPLQLPAGIGEGDAPQVVPVDAAGGRTINPAASAPDGYGLEADPYRNPGLLGDLFGMRHYDPRVFLVKDGRRVQVTLPAPYDRQSEVYLVGWVTQGGGR